MTAPPPRRPLLTSLPLFAAAFGVAILISVAPHPRPLSATIPGRAQQHLRTGFTANELNEWSSLRVTQGEDPHAYGIEVDMWRNDTTIAAYLFDYGGNVADPRTGRADSVKFDERSGSISFAVTTRTPAILEGSPSVVLVIIRYEFNGVIDDSTMRGTLRQRGISPRTRAHEESIVFRKAPPTTSRQPTPTFQSWLLQEEEVLKFQSGGNYETPPLQPAPGAGGEVEPECVVLPEQNRDAVSVTGTVSRGQRFVQQTRGGWIFALEPREWGWEIAVGMTGRESENLSRLNRPLRTPSPRHVDGWNFRNLENTAPGDGGMDTDWLLRRFMFSPRVGREIDSRNEITDTELGSVASYGQGWLFIREMELTPMQQGVRASFTRIVFAACLTWPRR